MDALIANARFHFHERLFETNTLTLTSVGVVSNADTSSRDQKPLPERLLISWWTSIIIWSTLSIRFPVRLLANNLKV